ncbi:MAG: DMT family transporter [Thermodesulfobacteriota bacterium]
MIGSLLAVLSGLAFAVSNVYIRQGVHRAGESFSVIPISAFLGTVAFGMPLLISGEIDHLKNLTYTGAAALAAAGIFHFILGRIFAYNSFRLIGANRAAPILSLNILFATLLGIFFLDEPLSAALGIAILLIFFGLILIGTTGKSEKETKGIIEGSLIVGIFAGLAAGLCWGISPAFVKIGLKEIKSPLLATFVSYISAAVIASILLVFKDNHIKLRGLQRQSFLPLFWGSLAVAVAQLLRYTAINFTSISIVTALMGTWTLFIYPLSFFINRGIEPFTRRVISGAFLTLAGVFLIFALDYFR